jgi:hypothetical protein
MLGNQKVCMPLQEDNKLIIAFLIMEIQNLEISKNMILINYRKILVANKTCLMLRKIGLEKKAVLQRTEEH